MATDQGNGDQGQESGAGNQGQGQEPASQEGQQGQEPAGQQGTGNGGDGNGPVDISKLSEAELRTYAAKVQKDLGSVRQESAAHRTARQAAEAKVAEAERAKMSEQERLQADLEAEKAKNAELSGKLNTVTVGNAAKEALNTAGAINGSTALKVLGEVPTKEDGAVDAEALAKAITELKKSDPYLFKRGANANAGEGGGQQIEGGPSVNDFIRGRTGR